MYPWCYSLHKDIVFRSLHPINPRKNTSFYIVTLLHILVPFQYPYYVDSNLFIPSKMWFYTFYLWLMYYISYYICVSLFSAFYLRRCGSIPIYLWLVTSSVITPYSQLLNKCFYSLLSIWNMPNLLFLVFFLYQSPNISTVFYFVITSVNFVSLFTFTFVFYSFSCKM